jgi:hypothetical protein
MYCGARTDKTLPLITLMTLMGEILAGFVDVPRNFPDQRYQRHQR